MAGSAPANRPAVIVYREFLIPKSETFILSQASALRRFDPTLVGRRRVEGLDLNNISCELINAGGPRGRAREFAHRLGFVSRPLVGRLAERRPLLLHAHFGPDALNALPLKRRLRVPLVATFHGYDATRRAERSAGALHARYVRRLPLLIREASCLLAVSDHVRSRLLATGFPAEKVRTHYIGVDTGRLRPSDRSGREAVVLAVGRLVEKKGFTDLIDAMALVRRAVPEARLVVIGAGPLESDLRARARAADLQGLEMIGSRRHEEVIRWMRRARVLAVPSVTAKSGETEGLPMTLLEGMASGLPAVATRHAGIPEAISHNVSGLLVPEHDPASLAEALIALLTRDDRWDEMSSAGRRRAEERFDLRKQTDELEQIYEEVANCPLSIT